MVIFEDRNNKITVTIEDDVLEALHQSALESYPNETGGFLVGNYISNNHAHVTCLVQPVKKTCRPCSFERSTEGMKTVWDNLFEQGLIYLGEWHTHPNGSRDYSITDLEAMRIIASSADVHSFRSRSRGDLPRKLQVLSIPPAQEWRQSIMITSSLFQVFFYNTELSETRHKELNFVT